jgi:translocation and assembly module TamB
MVSTLVSQVNLADFQALFRAPLPAAQLRVLRGSGQWENGPAELTLEARVGFEPRPGDPITAMLGLNADRTQLVIDKLEVVASSAAILTASGSFPILFNPAEGKLIQTKPAGPLQFDVVSKPNSRFWEEVAKWTEVRLVGPQVRLAVNGTLENPKGQLEAEIASLTVPYKTVTARLDGLKAEVALTEAGALLNTLTAQFEEQPLSATGFIPLNRDFWRSLAHTPKLPDWKNANVQVDLPEWKVAAFTPYLPALLAPEGTMSLHAALLPNNRWDGQLTLKGVGTRPYKSLSPVDDLNGVIRLEDRTARIERLAGRFGGELFRADGKVDFSTPGLPGFDLAVQGTNLPIVRQPLCILRGDVDLVVTSTNRGQPVVAGHVQLREGFYFAELQTPVSGRLARPEQRPPYFSIEGEPIADWKLDLTVKGNRFLKVRNLFFQGEVSTDARVTGTLREPMALGQVQVDTGFIRFPFADLRVSQGLVTLTTDDPYRPHLFVNASSRVFGYDTKMEVRGPADEAVIEFSSTPALSTEEIVRMITAGELPQNQSYFSQQQRVGQFAVFLGKNLLSKLNPDDPSADRLSINSGQDIAGQGRITYSVEYKLNEHWFLVGEYDRFSDLNAGLKWRVYSR